MDVESLRFVKGRRRPRSGKNIRQSFTLKSHQSLKKDTLYGRNTLLNDSIGVLNETVEVEAGTDGADLFTVLVENEGLRHVLANLRYVPLR